MNLSNTSLTPHRAKRLSKFLSLVLRHEPEAAHITLDENGWVEVKALLAGMGRAGLPATREELAEIVATNDKRRFAFNEDATRIRASQGHSVAVDLALAPVQPPETLYHGTAETALESIRRTGLHPQTRQHVHLSVERETAARVGGRHGKPAVLTVRSGAMAGAGHAFYRSANGVWLTEHVPPEYLEFPP